MNKTIELEGRYCAHNYAPLPVVLVKGEGVFVWDDQGKRYLDMMSAYSAVSHGHCHPRLLEVMWFHGPFTRIDSGPSSSACAR